MYRIATIEDRIRVPPEKLGTDVAKALRMAIAEQMEGVLNSRLGMVLSVVAIVIGGRRFSCEPLLFSTTTVPSAASALLGRRSNE